MTPELDQTTYKQMLQHTIAWRIAELNLHVLSKTSGIVQAGPFRKMLLTNEVIWGTGDIAAKLLGTYEQELHGAIECAIGRMPDVVYNVGAAEGYYAIGFAQRLPDALVIAIDTNPAAQEIISRAASANRVAIISQPVFDSEILACLSAREHGLIFMDTEGAEAELLNAETVAKLGNCDVIIECHEHVHQDVTEDLRIRFCRTHDTEIITEGWRNPNAIPLLRKMCSLDRWLVVNENRPSTMQWLVCWARDRE